MTFDIDAKELAPVIDAAVNAALARFAAEQAKLAGDWLAISEERAARLLDLDKPSQLRDARLRGEITASQITGRRIRYTRQDLQDYLANRRYSADPAKGGRA